MNAFPPGPRRRAAGQRRKACGSMLAARDVHPRVTMQILRHSKSAIMMKIYTEVSSAATRARLRKHARRSPREHDHCCICCYKN